MVGALLAGEVVARAKAPGEVLGWGERPSLAPSDAFGWTLRPDSTTHLRWLTYDYRVTANSLGFPGPEPTPAKAPGVVRILVTGDAYSSAEGVDTERSWVARLGPALAARGVKAEVLNFAITGYGPHQEAAVVAHFAPIYQPDLVVVESFVNDYADETATDQEFRDGIGFGRPSSTAPLSLLRFGNLSAWAGRVRSGEATAFFSGSIFLDHPASLPAAARTALQHDWASIAASAAAAGGRAVVVGVPAAAQVCRDRATPEQYASHVPQDAQRSDAAAAGMGWIDTTDTLRAQAGCPYFAHNLHWIDAGHAAVASWLAEPGRLVP